MTVEENFTKLLSHMAKGVMIHDQMSVIYGFLGLEGYQCCHEYHYLAESKNYKCLQNYFLEEYYKMIPVEPVEQPNLVPSNWYKYTTIEVDTGTKRSTVKDLMKQWVEWERETKKLLETSYKELYEAGEICAALKIKEFLKDVSKELKTAQRKYIKLETIGYDINYIIGKQKMLAKKYKEKME